MATHPTEISAVTASARYHHVREQTLQLVAELMAEDTVVQTMPDVSPTKWHLAHVTWFFERFVLEPSADNYTRFSDQFHYLFNSYYYSAGEMHARPKRGLLSRPTLMEILDYRAYVDTAVQQLLQSGDVEPATLDVIVLGLHHEQQHQELLLTDIKHVFSCNPLRPAVSSSLEVPATKAVESYAYQSVDGGIRPVG